MPLYKHASYAGETITIENKHLRLDIHKRIYGWGWGEILTPDGKFMAVLEHFGEVMVRDQEIPMRFEAAQVRREADDHEERLIFQVQSTVVQEKLVGTSFEQWMHYPFIEPCLKGEVVIRLHRDEAVIRISYRFKSKANLYVRYIRGPWLKIGADSFGTEKHDAILPGVEWLIDSEWSSGTDWFKDPWAMKVVPHPHKVAIPLMAVSHEGTGIGLAWNPTQIATQWFNNRRHHPQPVFASPNFVERMNNQLLGLMVPEVDVESHENQICADPPLELHLDQPVEFDAEIFLTTGNSLQAIVDWLKRHGMPEVPIPRWPLEETLDRIAAAYNTRFWYEGRGFGNAQDPNHVWPHIPHFAERYVKEKADGQLARELQTKLDWCHQQKTNKQKMNSPLQRGQELLAEQRADGAFGFAPDGRHYVKDDFVVARALIEPMGLDQDTALDMCVVAARELLHLAQETGAAAFKEGARKALEYCMAMERPEGGDYWETPLHSPNLLAAGHAALTYYLGYETFGDLRYKDKAVHWIRCLLPFTHLWQPACVEMLYNTKPCLCSSDWYFANWVRDHVQWEVLQVFADSVEQGIDWGKVDPEVDWHRYHEGITVAAIRWMIDHTRENWYPHNLPSTYEAYRQGLFDDCFPDTHNSVTGNYGGMMIMPDAIAANIYGVLDYRK